MRHVLAAVAAAVLLSLADPRPALADGATTRPAGRPALWAVYYAWYQTATPPHRKWTHWSDDGASVQTPRPKSKAHPLIGYYDSDDPAVIRWHVRLAQQAGIEAFVVSWWGPGSLSDRVFEKVLLPIAAEEKFQVALCSELAQFHHDVKVLARQTIDVLRRTKDSPAYLRIGGRPVVYLYQVPFAPKLTPATFERLRTTVEAEVGSVYWAMDKIARRDRREWVIPEEWLKVGEIPMFGFYGTFSVERVWAYADLLPHYQRMARQARSAGRKVFLPVHPGHDNSGFRPDDNFVIPRDDGATLRGYLRAVADAGVDVALVTSFNEWPETTVVEPSSSWSDPYQYLKILAEWKGRRFIQPPLPERKK